MSTQPAFPSTFQWGVGTSSYQIEGAWNADGKGPHIWDVHCHNHPERIVDGSNGDVACNSYHNIDRDVEMLKEMKVTHYRFSLCWSRILPDGTVNNINHLALEYYGRLVDQLIANGIEPVITLYHWELPQALQARGGWLNRQIVDWFADYARLCFKTFGNRVHTWVTLNEPWVTAWFGHDALTHPPYLTSDSSWMPYLVIYHQVIAHGTVYRMFKNDGNVGEIGLAVNCCWTFPADATSPECRRAASLAFQHQIGLFMNPIYGAEGGWPSKIAEIIRARVIPGEIGRNSRLPKFSPEEIEMLKEASDFFGLNYYHSAMIAPHLEGKVNKRYSDEQPDGYENSRDRDTFSVQWKKKSWYRHGPPNSWLTHVPIGLYATLCKIRNAYGNPRVIITENGCPSKDEDGLEDNERIRYIKEHVQIVRHAIADGCNVAGYYAWSLMDNFEWSEGYTYKFGMFLVDMNSDKQTRTAKKSVGFYRTIVESNGKVLDVDGSDATNLLANNLAAFLSDNITNNDVNG